jgi:hypothetical protein
MVVQGSKENFAPLRSGRSAAKLGESAAMSLKPNSADLKLQNERQLREFSNQSPNPFYVFNSPLSFTGC